MKKRTKQKTNSKITILVSQISVYLLTYYFQNIRPQSANIINNAEDNQKQTNPALELKLLIKNHGYNKKKLVEFKKKYRFLDLAAYMHRAEMEEIKARDSKIKQKISQEEKLTNQALNILGKESEFEKNEPEIISDTEAPKINSYLKACIYNNSELIKAFLLATKSKIVLNFSR